MVTINPHSYDDQPKAPKDWNSANSMWEDQLHQPLTLENQRQEDDFKNYYVPNRGRNSYGMYAQKKSGVKKHNSKKAHAQHNHH